MMKSQSFKEAQDWLRKKLREGAKCPVCTQLAKIYSRKLTAGLARGLIGFYRAVDGDPSKQIRLDIINNKRLNQNGDFPLLRYWGLVEEVPKSPEKDAKNSGFWRITSNGIAFVERRLTVRSHAKTYDSKFYGFEGDEVDIVWCLGQKFSYEELMRS